MKQTLERGPELPVKVARVYYGWCPRDPNYFTFANYLSMRSVISIFHPTTIYLLYINEIVVDEYLYNKEQMQDDSLCVEKENNIGKLFSLSGGLPTMYLHENTVLYSVHEIIHKSMVVNALNGSSREGFVFIDHSLSVSEKSRT